MEKHLYKQEHNITDILLQLVSRLIHLFINLLPQLQALTIS